MHGLMGLLLCCDCYLEWALIIFTMYGSEVVCALCGIDTTYIWEVHTRYMPCSIKVLCSLIAEVSSRSSFMGTYVVELGYRAKSKSTAVRANRLFPFPPKIRHRSRNIRILLHIRLSMHPCTPCLRWLARFTMG